MRPLALIPRSERPSAAELEARNVLKTSRLRHSAIDFDEAASTLTVHLKKRVSTGAQGPPGPSGAAAAAGSGGALAKSPSLPSGRLVEPPEAGEERPVDPATAAALRRQHTSADYSTGPALQRGMSEDTVPVPESRGDASTLLRETDFLTDRGFMTRESNHAVAEAMRLRDFAKAHAIIADAARRVPRDQRDQLNAIRANKRVAGRRNTISVGMAEVPERNAPAPKPVKEGNNDDEDELRCITNTTLILERIRLEKSLDAQLAGHLKLALQYLNDAQVRAVAARTCSS